MAIPKIYTSQSIRSEVNRLIRLHPRENLGPALLEYIEENFIPKLELKAEDRLLDPDVVFEIVQNYFRVKREDLLQRSRRTAVLYPRQMAQFFLYRHSPLQATGIGRLFNMDHTSVLSSKNRIIGLCQSDAVVQEDFDAITKLIIDKKRELYGKNMEDATSLFPETDGDRKAEPED